MIIKFNPQYTTTNSVIELVEGTLKYNEEEVVLADIPNGATASNEYITIDKDMDGNIELVVRWQYTEPTNLNGFPADIVVDDNYSGVIAPIKSTKESEWY